MFDRLLSLALGLVAVAVAIHVAARLIESVAGVLITITAVIGSLIIIVLLTRGKRRDRW